MKKISNFYPPILELLPYILILCVWGYTIVMYPMLPDPIPSHFNGTGLPDAWMAKSWGSVLLLPIIAAVVVIFMGGLNLYIMSCKDPTKAINIPVKRKDQFTQAELETIRTFTVRSFYGMNLTVAALLTYIGVSSIRISLGEQESLGWPIWLFVGLLIGFSAFMTWKSIILLSPKK